MNTLTQSALSDQAELTWKLTFIFYLLYIGSFVANFIQLYNPTKLLHWSWCLIQLLPALAFFPGIVKKQRRPIMWFCFVLMLYFCFTVTNLPRTVTYPWLSYSEFVAIIALFCSALYFGKYTKATKPTPTESRVRGLESS